MKNLYLSIVIILSCCFFCINANAQNSSTDDVELVVSGNGTTKDEAIKRALLNAIEQTYGTFVSSNTTILNDELIKDEIVTVSSGNVKSYEIITENNTDKGCDITLKATVSIGKLVSFVKSKGGEAELAGATFAINIKLNRLKQDNMLKALNNLRKKTWEIQKSVHFYDFSINVGEPKRIPQSTYNKSEYYMVDIAITASPNNNIKVIEDLNKEYEAITSDKENFEEIEMKYNTQTFNPILNVQQALDFMIIDDLGEYYIKSAEKWTTTDKRDYWRMYDGLAQSIYYYFETTNKNRLKFDSDFDVEVPYQYYVKLHNKTYERKRMQLEDCMEDFAIKPRTFKMRLKYTLDEIEKINSIKVQPRLSSEKWIFGIKEWKQVLETK